MPDSPPLVSVIVPVYNEEKTIEALIVRLREALKSLNNEVIVVDDGSRDRSALILAILSRKYPIRVLTHAINRGKGAAVRTGLDYVRGKIVVIQDADLEYFPEDTKSLIDAVSSGRYEVVYGSRNLMRKNRAGYRPFLWGGKLLSLITSLLFGCRLTDINTGYKIFRSDLLRSLNLQGDGFEFCEEVTAKILRRGVRIGEIPINYEPRRFSEGKKIRARDGLIGLWTLFKLRFQRT